MTRLQAIDQEMNDLRLEYLRRRAELQAERDQISAERKAKIAANKKAKGKGKAEREAQAKANEEAMERLKKKAEAMANEKAAKAWAFAVHPDHGGTNEEFIKAHRTWKYWEALARG